MYSEAYFHRDGQAIGGYEDYESDRTNLLKTARRRLTTIEGLYPARGRLLDVGCATGVFLEAAQTNGWSVAGTDISEFAVTRAKQRLRADVRRIDDLHESGWPDESFDIITLFDVIEHFPEPLEQLHAVNRLLKPAGLVAIYTPDVSSLAARITRSKWLHYKDEHLYYFDKTTLQRVLSAAGFVVLHTSHPGKDVQLAMVADRLKVYSATLGRAFDSVLSAMRASKSSLYVNPRDGLLMLAAKTGRLH